MGFCFAPRGFFGILCCPPWILGFYFTPQGIIGDLSAHPWVCGRDFWGFYFAHQGIVGDFVLPPGNLGDFILPHGDVWGFLFSSEFSISIFSNKKMVWGILGRKFGFPVLFCVSCTILQPQICPGAKNWGRTFFSQTPVFNSFSCTRETGYAKLLVFGVFLVSSARDNPCTRQMGKTVCFLVCFW